MTDLGDFLDNIYDRILKLTENSKYEKCLSCECYFELLYCMKEELSKQKGPKYQEMLEVISSMFNKRNEVKMHQCLDCDPCPPAEWTSELLRKLKI